MKPPLEIHIGASLWRTYDASPLLYETVRMKLISAGRKLDIDEVSPYRGLHKDSDPDEARIADVVYHNSNVPSQSEYGTEAPGLRASLIWDPIPDLWIYTRKADDVTMRHVREWWDDADMFDRYVTVKDEVMTLKIKATWGDPDETTA